ncbi:MAG: hypothetical protein JNM41_00760 [Flavipsychrobacter sp.]|nr:hypothetical protein [Flavipsychrobacter sp.]
MRSFYLLLFAICLLLFSCSKGVKPIAATCETTILGYRTVYDTTSLSPANPLAEWGTISAKTATMSRIVYIRNTPTFNQGIYHTGNMCYYTFRNNSDTDVAILYRIRPDGMVTELKDSLSGFKYDGLVFNKTMQKVYAFKSIYGASNDWLCEITTDSGKFMSRKIVAGIGRSTTNAAINATIDNSTGNIYYSVTTNKVTTLVKIDPEKAVLSEIFSKKAPYNMYGLCFNGKDNRMYCVVQDTSGIHFATITTGGTVTKLDTLAIPSALQFSSAMIDECRDEYIFTGNTSNDAGYLLRMNMTGQQLSRLMTDQIFQGLTPMR